MLRPWELNVEIIRENDTAIHAQIANKILEEIQLGRFSPGSALPGTRELAKKIHVNRKTVIQAYDELIAQGWLTSENKRGTFVSSRVLTINNLLPYNSTPRHLFAKSQLKNEITPTLSKRQLHDFIHFSEGLPDSRLIPFEVLSRAMRHALIISARNNKIGYGDPKGSSILREAISHMLNMERSLHTHKENICVVRGSQMGIFILAKILIQLGDNVVVERLGNSLARDAFTNCGANIHDVSHDDEGIDVEHLEELCKLHKIHVVYVSPHHQIPTTVTMSQPRRIRLLALSEQYNFQIIEDDSNHEFNFTQDIPAPLASKKNNKNVIYIGSLSKILTPDFRIGYIVASEELINLCTKQVMLIDRQGNQITELAIAELLHTGEIKKHILRTKKIYEERRSFLSNLLNEELNEFLTFKVADSGLAFWLELSSHINILTLIEDAKYQKVSFQPGDKYSNKKTQAPYIRIGFGNLNNDELRQGILRLKNAFSQQQIKLRCASK